MNKPIIMPDREWENCLGARREIIEILKRRNIPSGISVHILCDIEEFICGGQKTIYEKRRMQNERKCDDL